MRQFITVISAFALAATLCGTDISSLLVPLDQMRKEAAPGPVAGVARAVPVSGDQADGASAEADAGENTAHAAPQKEKASVLYVSRVEILDELRTQLETRFKPDGNLVVDSAQTWRPLPVADHDWRMELVRVSSQALSPRMVASFRILCGDAVQGEFQMQLSCSLMREVLVSSRRINRAEEVTMDGMQVQVRDVLGDQGVPVPVGESLSDYQVRGGVAPGQVLYWRDLELKPLVHRGQIVEAVAQEGYLRIAVKALVMEDGREGDLIHVRNLSSNRDIQAKILNENTVQVYF